jgi:hypothetical protein
MPQKDTLDNLLTPVCFRILSSSLPSVSIFSVSCYSIVSISVIIQYWGRGRDDVHIFLASEGRTIFSSLSICVKRG